MEEVLDPRINYQNPNAWIALGPGGRPATPEEREANIRLLAAAPVSRGLDAGYRERDQMLAQIMQVASRLDPRLQAVVMERLGFQVPKPRPVGLQDVQGMDATQAAGLINSGARVGGIGSKEDEQLQRQKQLAAFQAQLQAQARAPQQELNEQRLKLMQERYSALADQFQQQLGARQQQLGINQQAETRRSSTAAAPSIPAKQAQAIIESMALSGRSPAELASVAKTMGYTLDPTGGYDKGGFLGMGSTKVPAIGRAPAQPGAAGGAEGKKLTAQMKRAFLAAAGGDIAAAKEMAAANGFTE